MQEIRKIVLTGGPCAGKTTAMSWVQNAFTEKGYKVLFVPETATELISGGVAPWTCGSNVEYQMIQMRLQKFIEDMFEQAARTMPDQKILIVCDRGELDNRAYMTQEEFDSILKETGWNEVDLRDSYDAVFHLVTAAKGAEEFYTFGNNAARYETVEQARDLDNSFIAAWTGHPHLKVIDNSTDFEEKMMRLIKEISGFLGEPQPREVERKFLIEYPDIAELEKDPSCQKVDIIQTYLKANENEEVRVRQRGFDGNYIYFRTTKKNISDTQRIEMERRLNLKDYLRSLMEADPTRRPIRKTRYCMGYEGHYFEIDVYPFWNDKAIVDVELQDKNEEVIFPPCIKVIKEVTDDASYKNTELARI